MKKISSTDNQYIKKIAKLDSAKERYKQHRYSAHGIRICSTLIQAGEHIEQLFVTESMFSQAHNLCFQDSITVVSDTVMRKIAHTTTPSGVVGIFALPQKPDPETISSGIVLCNVTDPGNVGTLIRSCVTFGKKTIVCVEGVDPWNPKVIQASAGTIGSATIFRWSWQELLCNKKNLTLCALVVQDGTPPPPDKQYRNINSDRQ